MPPSSSNSSSLPVKVWLYGGSNDAGGISDPLYNGCNLAAAGNTIVVAVNYRLGPLGWLTLESAGIQGNFGLQDILLALTWVQTNIAAFGGDPVSSLIGLSALQFDTDGILQQKRVLLFGQSAGSADTFFVSSLPQAPSLIKAAIMESGGGRSYAGSDAANAYSAEYASLINCSTSDVSYRIYAPNFAFGLRTFQASCFRTAPVTTLNTSVPSGAKVSTVANGRTYNGWGPHVDGVIVPEDPGVAGVQVPAVFGWSKWSIIWKHAIGKSQDLTLNR